MVQGRWTWTLLLAGGLAHAQPAGFGGGAVLTVLDPSNTGRRCLASGMVCVATGPSSASAWTIELDAHLRRPAVAGNGVFLFYDLEDPRSVSNHEVVAMEQARVMAGRAVAARLRLSAEDGFRAG